MKLKLRKFKKRQQQQHNNRSEQRIIAFNLYPLRTHCETEFL